MSGLSQAFLLELDFSTEVLGILEGKNEYIRFGFCQTQSWRASWRRKPSPETEILFPGKNRTDGQVLLIDGAGQESMWSLGSLKNKTKQTKQGRREKKAGTRGTLEDGNGSCPSDALRWAFAPQAPVPAGARLQHLVLVNSLGPRHRLSASCARAASPFHQKVSSLPPRLRGWGGCSVRQSET